MTWQDARPLLRDLTAATQNGAILGRSLRRATESGGSGVADGLLELGGGRLRLTSRGRLLANEALLHFLPEPEPA